MTLQKRNDKCSLLHKLRRFGNVSFVLFDPPVISMVKRKRVNTPSSAEGSTTKSETVHAAVTAVDVTIGTISNLSVAPSGTETTTTTSGGITTSPVPLEGTAAEDKKDKVPIFKDPNFVHSNKSGQAANKKTRVWKNLKQIIAAERALPWGADAITYATLEAPPSFRPAKKYSDISGLPAKYADPQTKMRFASSDEFSKIRMLPADLVFGYLELRKANVPVP